MKILLLSHTGLVTGGAEQCLLEYVDVLINRGYKCKVIVPYKGDMTRMLSEKEIPWRVIGYGWATQPHRKVHPHRILSSTGNSLVRIFQEVEKFKPNIIITNTTVIPWGLYAGKAFDIPTVLLAHEIISDKDPSLKMVPNYKAYGEILNNHVDYVVYNSQFVKNEFADVLKLPKTSQEILYPLPPLDEAKINNFFRENVIGRKLKIAIFGALSPRKNQMEALRAAKLLRDRGIRNFSLDLYGDLAANPAYTRTLKRFIKDNSLAANVKVKGYTASVYEKMNEYNVVLSTATYEPFGRTIIEGQLFGRIVITNNTGGGLELVQDLSTGLVYKSGSPESLADKVAWVMDNQNIALQLGAEAKDKQFRKYITSSRYDPLIEAVEYFAQSKEKFGSDNIFDPLLSLFQYNHQLNNKYRHLYRLTHNRVTYAAKGRVVHLLSKVKKSIRQIV